MSRIIVDEDRHVRDGRDGGRWETVVGVRDILAQAVSRPTFVQWGSAHGAGYCWILDYLSITIVF